MFKIIDFKRNYSPFLENISKEQTLLNESISHEKSLMVRDPR